MAAPTPLAQPAPARAALVTPDEGQRVLTVAAEALHRLATTLGADFTSAAERLLQTSGRVVVTGMGKSGHVGRKIAATLASTGTPALFIHPSEASHGDLGMLATGDTLLALSNSGNTNELADILQFAARRQIPIVAITSGRDSMLAQAATLALILPAAPEACPHGLAPTTSTTMMLALGDALAVTLLQARGFSAADFRQLHPGGSLGRRLLRVVDVMHPLAATPLVPRGTLMRDALLQMTEKGFGIIGITAGAELVGAITDGDLRRHMGDHLLLQTVDQVMTATPRQIRPQVLAAEALAIMNSHNITSLFVAEEQAVVGIIRMHDCLRAGIS